MSERVVLAAEPREVTGKKVKRLRRAGIIPAIVYGQQDSVAIQIDQKVLRRALRQAGTSNLIDLQIGSDNRVVLARDIQQHLTRGDVMHVDFYEVNMKETIRTEATLIPVGESVPASQALGSDIVPMYVIEIECLPGDLISEIELNLAGIESPDDVIYVSDLPVPEGVIFITDPEAVVARFEYARIEEETTEDEDDLFVQAADAVEVIGKEDEEDF